ncbi:MAG: beta-galactosidase [Kribbellaceae bacterium]|nr:beta-galactosidase [Kribbellaceae bacterium]
MSGKDGEPSRHRVKAFKQLAWLLREPGVGVRRNEKRLQAAVEEYLEGVLRIVCPLQVENEYGASGDDQTYLKSLAEIIRQAGITVPLVTVDHTADEMLAAGGLDGVLRTGRSGRGVRSGSGDCGLISRPDR